MEFKIGDKVRFKGGADIWCVVALDNKYALCTFCSFSLNEKYTISISDIELVERPKQKKLVPHWPAILQVERYSRYVLSDNLYAASEIASKRPDFVRLATELPPIMIEVEEQNKKSSYQKKRQRFIGRRKVSDEGKR